MTLRGIIIEILIILRLLTNDLIFLENKRPIPKKRPAEVSHFIRRPPRKGFIRLKTKKQR